jgi:hypothetical protein
VSEAGPVIYIEIPLEEFERLHAEIRNLKAAIEQTWRPEVRVLRIEVDRLSRALSHS